MKVKEYISSYYNAHENALRENYPGLGIDRLLNEYLCFSHLKSDEENFNGLNLHFWEQLETGVPLEYINHSSFFYRSNFFVDENVLIPRSETEILVEDSINYISRNFYEGFKVAEVGTGSFCIGLSIAVDVSQPINLWGGDLSLDAVSVSSINYFRLKNKIHPQTKIEIQQSDKLLRTINEFDLIVSNPPYIRRKQDYAGVHGQAHNFEPHIALYLDDQAFGPWFDDLFEQSSSKLRRGGVFFMEGHEDSLLQLQKIAMKYFSKVEIKKDYTKRDRFLHAFI